MGKETAGLGLDGGLGLPVPSSDESQSLGGGGIDGGDGGDGGMERGTGLLGGARSKLHTHCHHTRSTLYVCRHGRWYTHVQLPVTSRKSARLAAKGERDREDSGALEEEQPCVCVCVCVNG